MDRPGVRQVPEGSGEQGKMKKTGCKIICGAPTTLAVKGLMMMMMMKDSNHSIGLQSLQMNISNNENNQTNHGQINTTITTDLDTGNESGGTEQD